MKNHWGWSRFAPAAAALGLICGVALLSQDMAKAQEAKNPTIEARKKLMRGIGKNMKAIKSALKAGGSESHQKIKDSAEDISNLARKISAAFQKETLKGKTTATAKIWKTKSDFDQIASNLASSAKLLASAAGSGDVAGIQNGVKTVGANCGKCHKAYRTKKKKK